MALAPAHKVGFVQCRSMFSKRSYENKRFKYINSIVIQANGGNFCSEIAEPEAHDT